MNPFGLQFVCAETLAFRKSYKNVF